MGVIFLKMRRWEDYGLRCKMMDFFFSTQVHDAWYMAFALVFFLVKDGKLHFGV